MPFATTAPKVCIVDCRDCSVSFVSCEDDVLIPIRRRTFAASTQKRARRNRRMVFRSTSFAEIKSSPRCLAIASMAANRARGVPRENSSEPLCAVCLEESLSDSSEPAAIAAVFLTVDFPTFDESWRKIFRTRRDPSIDDRLRKECPRFNLCLVWR